MDFTILNQVQSPASYTGGEWGSVDKTPDDQGPRWVLAFPDTHSIGMSHLGIQILYHILNTNPTSAAQRVFTPQKDMQKLMVDKGIPLCSLESGTPLNQFDVVGFSLLYELCYTNVLAMLKLGGIPVRSVQRSESDPIVIAGGPCTTNPDPVAPFFDAFVIGEGEDVVLEINAVVHAAKKERLDRGKLLGNLSKVGGVYVPAIHAGMSRLPTIYARKVIDLDQATFPTSPVVPLTEAIHDRAVVEIARGCPHACRFCHAGYLGRPHRERKPSTVWKLAVELLANTGYEDLTLLSLSAGDYHCLPQIVAALSAKFAGRGVAINLPSLRAGSLTPEVVEGIRSMRKTGFTIAPEAGTQRLRAVINKNLSDEEILDTTRLVFKNGWDLIKLYFMFGLPTETDEDLEAIVNLVRKVRNEGRKAGIKPRINVSLSAFVPKPHTPFQWDGMLDEEEIEGRLDYFRKNMRLPGVRLKWSRPFMSVLEGVFARGDLSLAAVIERAWESGAAFDAWGESLERDLWKRAFDEEGIDMGKYAARTIGLDETLPWEHINVGVDKEWLARDRQRAMDSEASFGCDNAPCSEICDACDTGVEPVRFDDAQIELPRIRLEEKPESFAQYRLTYEKTGPARFLGHLDTVRTFQRAMRRAGINVLHSKGFHPKPRMSFSEALSVGIASMAEMADARIHRSLSPGDVMDRLNCTLPRGFGIISVNEISKAAPSIEETPRRIKYLFEMGFAKIADKRKLEALIGEYNAAAAWHFEKKRSSGVKRLDLKEIIDKIELTKDGVEMEVVVGGEAQKIGIIKVYEALFGPLSPQIAITKIDVIFENIPARKIKAG